MFRFFDPNEQVEIHHRNLPHWEQPGVCYFLTFRTADSLPQAAAEELRNERDCWLESHVIDTREPDWHFRIALLPKIQRDEYHNRFSWRMHALLDAGHGECLLQRCAVRAIVENSLKYFDGQRYLLGDFVIMPNHVHLLVQFQGSTTLKQQTYGWKKFTAREINNLLGRRGHFWQGETYDHIVRSERAFLAFRKYIFENPKKAGLRTGEYSHYRCSWEPGGKMSD